MSNNRCSYFVTRAQFPAQESFKDNILGVILFIADAVLMRFRTLIVSVNK